MEPNEIKAFRKARNQSQAAFGADLAVDRKTVQRWEHGETRPPGRLLDLACRQLESGFSGSPIVARPLEDSKQLEHAQRDQAPTTA